MAPRNPLKAVASTQKQSHVDPTIDAWALDDKSYDVNKIYKASAVNSETIRARVDSALMGRVSAIIHGGHIPEYRTPSDFVRDAIHHRLKWVEDHFPDPALHNALQTHRFLSATADRAERMKGEQMVVDQTRELLQNALGNRDWLIFDEQIAAAKEVVDDMIGKYRDDMRVVIKRMEDEARRAR